MDKLVGQGFDIRNIAIQLSQRAEDLRQLVNHLRARAPQVAEGADGWQGMASQAYLA
ncbi:hypothetical protein [Tumebacillus flagellatus]|uniref:hypothetical protein n=1 Tax=Tumebacillus flagellatus TaxID=1157490 RepID=UPI0013784C30|nr:hypothetical protein [Tumebacillus flagellatus]